MISNIALMDRMIDDRFESLVRSRDAALMNRAPIRRRVGRVLVHVGTWLEQRPGDDAAGTVVPGADR